MDASATELGIEPDERVVAAVRKEMDYYAAHAHEGTDEEALADLRARCAALLSRELDREVDVEQMMRLIRFRAYPDAPPALAALHERGLALVCVSNWDVSLPQVLDRCGLGGAVDGVVTSADGRRARLGDLRPRRAAGCAPSEALHVGDRPEEDLAGAEAAGIRGLLIDRNGGADRVAGRDRGPSRPLSESRDPHSSEPPPPGEPAPRPPVAARGRAGNAGERAAASDRPAADSPRGRAGAAPGRAARSPGGPLAPGRAGGDAACPVRRGGRDRRHLRPRARVAGRDLVVQAALAATLVGTAFVAANVRGSQASAADLGLRRPRGRFVRATLIAYGGYFVCALVIAALLQPEQEDVTRELGVDEGALAAIVAGVLIIGVAPSPRSSSFAGSCSPACAGRSVRGRGVDPVADQPLPLHGRGHGASSSSSRLRSGSRGSTSARARYGRRSPCTPSTTRSRSRS